MSDNHANPFTDITEVDNVYTDCGAHTITLWPGELEETGNLLVYVSSYPLGAGPTCGDTEHRNTANPFDEDPGSPNNPLHGVIQVVEVPVADPAASRESDVQPEISYPGDPYGRMEWCERRFAGATPRRSSSPRLWPATTSSCTSSTRRRRGVRRAGPGVGDRRERDPRHRAPDVGRRRRGHLGRHGAYPGAVDFFHSVMFDNDAETVNWVDESFGTGCPTMTTYNPRPWNPAAAPTRPAGCSSPTWRELPERVPRR